jgi:hypothetical protein
MNFSLFLLDYSAFRNAARPLIESADLGDFEPLLGAASEFAHGLEGGWILEGHGTNLKALDVLDAGNALAGCALLVSMSRYLSLLPFGNQRLDIEALARILAQLGWGEDDTRLLAEGLSHLSLIKPDEVEDPMFRPEPEDPRWQDPAYYWWWARPLNAYRTGWWDVESVRRLHDKLSNSQTAIMGLAEATGIPHPDMVGSEIRNYYSWTTQRFEFAMKSRLGLFAVAS